MKIIGKCSCFGGANDGKKPVLIYGLFDPETDEVRYVGKTTRSNYRARMKLHINSKDNCHRVNWIKSLKKKGLKPCVFILEECSENSWIETEKFWISYLRFIGCRLTNLTEGGDNCVHSLESRKKMSEQRKGVKFTLEHSRKIGEANRGRIYSDKTKAKISCSLIGKRLSSDRVKSIRTRMMGNRYALGHFPSDHIRKIISLSTIEQNFRRWHLKEFLTDRRDYSE